jgi:hypothetical protein
MIFIRAEHLFNVRKIFDKVYLNFICNNVVNEEICCIV